MTLYKGTWRSAMYPPIYGEISFALTPGINATPAIFEFKGVYNRGVRRDVILNIDPQQKTMSFEQITFKVDHFDDIISGTYESSFPKVDKGHFLVAKAGIEIAKLEGNDQCVLL